MQNSFYSFFVGIHFINGMAVTLLFFISCSQTPLEVLDVLDSTANKHELKKVIDHYKTTGDNDKLKAAYFLIGNMKDKHSLYYGYNEKIYDVYFKEKDRDKAGLKIKIDSLKYNRQVKPLMIPDMDIITSDYLTHNIELAFNVWKEPWSKHFNFTEFCEYILPYRIRNEPLSDWRQILYDEYFHYKDSVKNISDTGELALYINDVIALGFTFDDENILELPLVSITVLDKVKAGVCEQRYMYVVSVFRALGIPAMMEYTPQINKKYEDHAWVSYLEASHRLRAIDGGQKRDIPFVGNTGFRRAFPDSTIIPLRYGFGPTVFRYSYSVDKESLAGQLGNLKDIPQKFNSVTFKKVTDQYEFRKQDINIVLDTTLHFKYDIAWLTVFSVQKELRAADWTIVHGNKIKFKSIGHGLTYLICSFENGKFIPITNPLLNKNSVWVELNPDTTLCESVVLTRKFKPTLEYNNFSNSMVGAVIQGSNDSRFINAWNLFIIDKPPAYMEEGKVVTSEKFRYVRYYSFEKDIRIAEVEFWENDLRLNGKTIFSIKSDTIVPECVPQYAFDKNIHTNFNAPAGSWIGLDLGAPRKITHVGFLPRNNFNVIEQGNKYELFYFDKGWHSLGVKMAENQYLKYDKVPKNALLLLSNITQGKEERIFTYENGVQLFQ